ncbi:type III secretion system chaperone [uncultured Endozoicomonas sp.]|uniref:type III secretion system chaperone n=1 Tax=uncultured Endozoicomonas sp. TaxID=432652 RepID=UPI002606E5DB|nr:type III secretion system chaperone [uncultured Endozoicomonas sp.]
MTTHQAHFEHLVGYLGDIAGTKFPIINNSCTLVDSNTNDEKIVLELPEGSDLLMLHRLISTMPTDASTKKAKALQLLTLNSQPDKLQGAWFCIDPDSDGIHLMLGQPIENLNNQQFENLVFNYVELADQLMDEVNNDRPDTGGLDSSAFQGIQV